MANQLPAGDPVPLDGTLPGSALAELPERSFSVYLHVPFCRSRCGYCDFNTYTASELRGMSTGDYLTAALREIDLAARVLGGGTPEVDTVFVGGGTPTMLPAGELSRLLDAVRERFGLVRDAEITTEANPETVTPEYLRRLREAGFTRISLGMQSAVPHVLEVLERAHTPGRGIDAARWARQAGFEHVSLDLIFGAPGESRTDWKESLDAVAAAPVDHVSAYSLIVEQGTRLAMRVRRGEVPMPDDDELAEKYLMTEQHLTTLGFRNYETSNWARDQSARCRHNLAYWRGGNWWGIGPGAHSHIGGVRFWNRKHPRSYAAALADGHTPAQGREVLSPEDRRVERVMLELRLAEGLPLGVLTETESARVDGIVAEGLGAVVEGRLALTLRGRLLADGVVLRLLD
ncbi:coproporphyrinogen III oxidase [Arachnia propionica]|uniref:radical SAM family heme chaperone HemW n=1 Tax=Arachnia propionica TaxID=1750 RepID=UPI00059FC1B6|nr:radical SAM family heme chaperone HemW [Arachnia propionica]QCT38000.1 coproporphyrinogen III oxidase [Arachnia propionica]RPA16576.1 coproporphyrinogen III oxidase [Arachnia propionica]